MEELIKAVVLGIVQGLTEFLPISSTAHLRIIPSFFGWKDIGAAYSAVIQTGTMIAIIIYFRADLKNMFTSTLGSLKSKDWSNQYTRLLINIIVGTIPILILGYLLKGLIRNQFRDMYLIAGNLIFFSFIILLAEKVTKKNKSIESLTRFDAIFIGLFQAIALIPGTSRSGSSISGGFFRNLDREAAARYSFLLSIPAVFISGLYELFSERHELFSSGNSMLSLIVATVVSGIVGYWSIWFLLNYLKKHSMMVFIIYRILFGILIILLLYFKIILQ